MKTIAERALDYLEANPGWHTAIDVRKGTNTKLPRAQVALTRLWQWGAATRKPVQGQKGLCYAYQYLDRSKARFRRELTSYYVGDALDEFGQRHGTSTPASLGEAALMDWCRTLDRHRVAAGW